MKTPQSEWGRRAHAAGLDQTTLARLAGVSRNTVTRALNGHWTTHAPTYLYALILAWERMTEGDRAAWMAEIDAVRSTRAPEHRQG